MKRLKKLIFIISAVLVLALNADNDVVLRASAFSVNFDVHSEAVFMVNLDTDITVFRKNEFKPIIPASTTKIMTALIVLENVENLNEFVTVTAAMNTGFGANPNFTGAGVADFEIGQTNLTYLDCLYALMLHSACDAANILAHNIGMMNGGEGYHTFVQMMNNKARELGCVGTNFTNPHGLHEAGQFTTAYDLFLITKYTIENYPIFMEIAGTLGYEFPANSRHSTGLPVRNTNRLLRNNADNPHFYEFASGVKTGSLPYVYNVATSEHEPGLFGLVSTASRRSYTYLLVTLNAPFHTDPLDRGYYTYNDHLRLFRWAFSSLEYVQVLSAHDVLTQIPVINGQDVDRVQLLPAGEFNYLLPSDLDKSVILRSITLHNNEIEAPVTKGEILGFVELKLEGETLAVINLVAADDVAESIPATVQRRFNNFFFGTPRIVTDENGDAVFDEDGEVLTVRGVAWGLILTLFLLALIILVTALRLINNRRAKINARKNARKKRWQ
jgi:D-alanyl-D-alanine carboxypeptidase (penicillin-binding protein 5/6)